MNENLDGLPWAPLPPCLYHGSHTLLCLLFSVDLGVEVLRQHEEQHLSTACPGA
jgi:hypothetical protein